MPTRDQVRRRRAGALAAVAALAGGIVVVTTSGGDEDVIDQAVTTAEAEAKRAALPQLPGGGRRLFPDRRVVAFYGSPADPQLGALGVGSLRGAGQRLLKQAKAYERKTRPVLPAMELIVTLATADAGQDGQHRVRLPAAQIDRHLREARKVGALLILDIQPGRAAFGPEIERLEKWLREPDVGLALDPEWHVGPDETPGEVIGGVDADVVTATARYLSRLVRERQLPEKLLLVHRFTEGMIERDDRLQTAPGVQLVINVDGFGGRAAKLSKYQELVASSSRFRKGFKLFYEEDTNLLKPQTVLTTNPRPDVVVYE